MILIILSLVFFSNYRRYHQYDPVVNFIDKKIALKKSTFTQAIPNHHAVFSPPPSVSLYVSLCRSLSLTPSLSLYLSLYIFLSLFLYIYIYIYTSLSISLYLSASLSIPLCLFLPPPPLSPSPHEAVGCTVLPVTASLLLPAQSKTSRT